MANPKHKGIDKQYCINGKPSIYEPHREITCLWGFRQSETQTILLSYTKFYLPLYLNIFDIWGEGLILTANFRM